MKKFKIFFAAMLAAVAAFAVDTVTTNGVTYTRRGALDTRNAMVVTDVDAARYATTNDVEAIRNDYVSMNWERYDDRNWNRWTRDFYNSSIMLKHEMLYENEESNECEGVGLYSGMIEIFHGIGDKEDWVEFLPRYMNVNGEMQIDYPSSAGRLVVDTDLTNAIASVDVSSHLVSVTNAIAVLSNDVVDVVNVVSGEDMRLTVTNYDSVVHKPNLSIEYKLDGVWRKAWQEDTRLNPLEESVLDISYYMTNLPFGLCSSLTGRPSPTGLLQISHPIVQIGDRAEWHKAVSVNNSIYFLGSTSPTFIYSNANTNQDFVVSDQFGEPMFKIERGADKVVSADPSTFRNNGNGTFHLAFNISNDVAMAEALVVYANTKLDKDENQWRAMGDGLANITRLDPVSHGKYKEYGFNIEPYVVTSTMFFFGSYKSTGKNQMTMGAPVNFSKINLGNKTYAVSPKTINGELVLGLTEVAQ